MRSARIPAYIDILFLLRDVRTSHVWVRVCMNICGGANAQASSIHRHGKQCTTSQLSGLSARIRVHTYMYPRRRHYDSTLLLNYENKNWINTPVPSIILSGFFTARVINSPSSLVDKDGFASTSREDNCGTRQTAVVINIVRVAYEFI